MATGSLVDGGEPEVCGDGVDGRIMIPLDGEFQSFFTYLLHGLERERAS